jgi:hypothetical protein
MTDVFLSGGLMYRKGPTKGVPDKTFVGFAKDCLGGSLKPGARRVGFYSSRNAFVIGIRAANLDGNSPPSSPNTPAKIIAVTTRSGVI